MTRIPFDRRILLALHFALLVVVVLVYWPGLNGGFAFDDFPNIVENKALHVTFGSGWHQWLAAMFSSPASQLQRPLAMLSFAMNIASAGLDPFWMKLTNLAIHLLNTWLVFGLAKQLLRAANPGGAGHSRTPWPEIWIAAAWALNPINVMAVLFTVQRMESLCHTFVFAGLWLYVFGRRRLMAEGHGWPTLLIGLFAGTGIGVMVKESAALLPVYALVIEWALLHFASRRSIRDRRLLALFSAVVLLPAIAGLWWLVPRVVGPADFAGRAFSLNERLLSEPGVVLHYLRWTLLPDIGQMSLYHDDYPVSHGLLAPPTTLASILALAGLIVAAVVLRRRRPLMALGLAWFLAAQLLTATIIPLDLMYEHRNYFASLGVCIATADLLLLAPRTQRQQRFGAAAALVLVFLFAGVTALRAREWQDSARFAATEAARHPQSPRATYELARKLVILSEYRVDSPYFEPARAALDRAIRVPGAGILPETAAIFMMSRSGQQPDARWWASMRRKLMEQPIGPQETSALASLVDCAIKSACPLPQQQMLDTFAAATQKQPNAEVLNIYGNYALNVLHQPDLALDLWKRAAELAPRVVEYQVTLSKMLIVSGELDQSERHIARIRQLGRLGQNESAAAALDRQLAQARAQQSAPVH